MELKWCSAHRMAECQSRGMEGLARGGSFQQLRPAPGRAGDAAAPPAGVDRIAHDRVADVLEVDSDLMGPAGVQLQAQQVHHIEPGDHGGIGAGGPAPRRNAHPLAVASVARDGSLDAQRARLEMTPGQRSVRALHPAGGNGGAQSAVSQIGFGDKHEA